MDKAVDGRAPRGTGAEVSSAGPPKGPRLSPTESTVVTTLRASGSVFAEEEARLLISTAATSDDLTAMVNRRVSGVPLEHVIGWAEFCGLRIVVEPGVFVPRRRTELLVDQAARLTSQRAGCGARRQATIVVDLCCGSGAVGAAVVQRLGMVVPGKVELYAADIDPVAVSCAHRNLDTLGGRVYEGDLYDPLPRGLAGRIDVLVANVPYVPTDAIGLMPSEARLYEPHVALDGGVDGLEVMRRVAAAAPQWLAPGGHLLVETSERQVTQALDVFAGNALTAGVLTCDERGGIVVYGALPVTARHAR
jgi:release factor glutamine methyltransferase